MKLRLLASLTLVFLLVGCAYDRVLYRIDGIKYPHQLGWGPRFTVVTQSDIDFYSECPTPRLLLDYVDFFGKPERPKERDPERFGRYHQHKAEMKLALALRRDETVSLIKEYLSRYLTLTKLEYRLKDLSDAEKEASEELSQIGLLENKWSAGGGGVPWPTNEDKASLLLNIFSFCQSPKLLEYLEELKKTWKEECPDSSFISHIGFRIDEYDEEYGRKKWCLPRGRQPKGVNYRKSIKNLTRESS